MEHKTLQMTFKHLVHEKYSELDQPWYKEQEKEEKSKRDAIFAYKANDG